MNSTWDPRRGKIITLYLFFNKKKTIKEKTRIIFLNLLYYKSSRVSFFWFFNFSNYLSPRCCHQMNITESTGI